MSIARRSSFQIMLSVIRALSYREFKTRIGRTRFGWLWIIGDPIFQVAILSVIWSVRGNEVLPEVNTALFLLTGIIPYEMCMKIVGQCIPAVETNRGLFAYKQVKPIDCFLTRAYVESVILSGAFLILLGVSLYIGLPVESFDVLPVVAACGLLMLMGLGFGILFGTLAVLVQDLAKVLPWLFRPFYFISGVIFPLTVIPPEYTHFISWNPIAHLSDQIRIAFFEHYPRLDWVGWTNPLVVTLSVWILALLVYRRYRFALVAS